MKLRDLIILLLISFASLLVPGFIIIYLIAGEPPPSTAFPTWSSLLLAQGGIFPAHLDPISRVEPVGYFDTSTVVTELEELLDDPKVLVDIYENYKIHFHKNVSQDLSLERREIFRTKLIHIAVHNFEFAMGIKSWMKGVTQFTDLAAETFLSNYSGKAIPPSQKSNSIDTTNGNDEPNSTSNETTVPSFPQFWDWRSQNVVTPIKDQGQCCSSSCVFAVTSLIESAMARTQKNQEHQPLDLSEQELMDCAFQPTTQNGTDTICHGNWPTNLLDYVQQHGLSLETNYPLDVRTEEDEEEAASHNACQSGGKSKAAAIMGYGQTEVSGDEEDWKNILMKWGELVVVAKINSEWPDYRGGYFDFESCHSAENALVDNDNLHCLNIIGYGVDREERPYWIIKNSWGVTWGQKGFMRLARNVNACGINDFPAFYVTAI